jgi:hypothetical protein
MSWLSSLWSGIKGFGAAGGFGLATGIGTNIANAYQASINRNWQERMSSTAHQREVSDLKQAGLNPVLSATGGSGASTPSGSMATMTDPGQGIAQAMREKVALKNQAFMQKATIKKMSVDAAVAQSQEVLNSAKALEAVANTELSKEQKFKIGKEIEKFAENIALMSSQRRLTEVQRAQAETALAELERARDIYKNPRIGVLIKTLKELLNVGVHVPIVPGKFKK